jgi:hypothetical protein
LEAAFKDMRPNVISEVTVKGNIAVGVGIAPKRDYSGPPPTIPPPPYLPELEVLDDDASLDMPDDELDDFLGPEPLAPRINLIVAQQIVQSEPEPEPEEMATVPDGTVEPAVEPLVLRSGKPLSPLAADLLARARAPLGSPDRTKPIA